MRKCNEIEINGNQEQECGRPSFTNASSLCEKHYAMRHEKSYIRIKDGKADPDPMTQFIKANDIHVLSQMLEAYGEMYKMRDFLKPQTVTDWFLFKYQKNPLCQEALDKALKMTWEHESGEKPMDKAMKELNELR